MGKIILLISVLFLTTTLHADVRLPQIFGDNMVLQRDQPTAIWGWSSPREKITVLLNKQSKTIAAGKDGKWKMCVYLIR
ncbi:MAG: hypothetical protein WD824_12065 [Cyclobacteriaceae bacterium]